MKAMISIVSSIGHGINSRQQRFDRIDELDLPFVLELDGELFDARGARLDVRAAARDGGDDAAWGM